MQTVKYARNRAVRRPAYEVKREADWRLVSIHFLIREGGAATAVLQHN